MKRNLTKSSLARLYYIDGEIARGTYPSATTLAKGYEAGRATICRDIEFLRDRLGAPIEYSAKHRGYYYAEKTFRLSAAFAGGDDLLALACIKTLISLYRNTPFYEKAQAALDAITAPFAESAIPQNRIVVPALASYTITAELWEPLIAALRQNRTLAFEYQSTWTRPFEKRLVHPYQLLFDSGAWYLYGFSVERNDRRIFSLSRIKNISLTGDAFTLPRDFDYRTLHGASFFGVYAGGRARHFRVKFTGDFVLWAQERRWAQDQRTTEIPEGVILDFTSTQYGKVLEWALSKGAYATPLAPKEFVADWEAHINGMRKNAGTHKKH